ncbi:hypothetical protein Pmar_PMAR008684 [Perkinsus marinus ATCC 50983]|uniref:Uncharacterized protein n=1 Tax=Perkinsus marinus (strain ATCC 50983 / TXsc) TaxID=423536 RepID=C5KJ61_PERM5|nr:hypothetical protein Pmar_PMAR008684 [Perkinsus marinus ATCC 50983]EER15482.1 hypothetical protein Pmar_PMAR008684 [Perkinsus marinus ATCC 50983]|eukprot:XP_002783686.1 hypothetical protein Pmar_PMAR008684 [Perkinsus marinus ATCC 50983]
MTEQLGGRYAASENGKVVCNRSTYGAPLQTVSTPTGVEESWVAAHTQPRRDELTLGTTYPAEGACSDNVASSSATIYSVGAF